MTDREESFEDLKNCALTPEREQELLDAQRECVFSWTNKKGEAVGVIVSYFNHGGKIWMTCAESRARVAAIKRFPRASVCITSSGTRLGTGKTITYKGDCIVHKDRETLDWFILPLRVTAGQRKKELMLTFNTLTPQTELLSSLYLTGD